MGINWSRRNIAAFSGAFLAVSLVACWAICYRGHDVLADEEAFTIHCVGCHGVRLETPNGPSVLAIYNHYNRVFPGEAALRDALRRYIQNPREEHSQMPEAIRRFGLKHRLVYESRQLEQSINYLINAGKSAPAAEPEIDRRFLDNSAHPGAAAFARNCLACHSLRPPPRNAPPVRGIARNYFIAYPEKQAFCEAIIAHAHNPDPAKSIMRDAVDRFGPMPRLRFQPEDLANIADWIWEQK